MVEDWKKRIIDHAGRDKNSHVIKYTLDKGHEEISMDNGTIISKNFNHYHKRKVSEALFIKSKNRIILCFWNFLINNAFYNILLSPLLYFNFSLFLLSFQICTYSFFNFYCIQLAMTLGWESKRPSIFLRKRKKKLKFVKWSFFVSFSELKYIQEEVSIFLNCQKSNSKTCGCGG